MIIDSQEVAKISQGDISASEKIESMYFSLVLLQSTTKNPGHYIQNKLKKNLKGKEKKGRLARDFGIRE